MRDISPLPDRTADPAAVPCTARDLDISLIFTAKGVPFGVTPQHIREYLAAFIENREPNLHVDILDVMPGIEATMVSSIPKLPAPEGRPCPACDDRGYSLTQHEAPCTSCQGEKR